jgi:outer membrane protein
MRLLSVLVVFVLWPAIALAQSEPASAPASAPTAPPGGSLTLEQAIDTAHAHQPQIIEARAQTEAANAKADESHASLMPQISGNASFGVSARSSSTVTGGTGTVGTFSSGLNDSYSASIGASWLIWDFQQTRNRWHAAEANAAAQLADEQSTDLTVLLDVRTAFFNALAAKALVKVAEETLANEQAHLSQTETFVKVGTYAPIALAQNRTNVANARVSLITAQNGYDTTRAQLNQQMGVETSIDYDVVDTAIPPIPGEDGAPEPLLDAAFKTRPELAAFVQSIRSQELSYDATRHNWLPSLSVSTQVSDSGSTTSSSGTALAWTAGVNLSWPIWLGGAQRAQVREAQANLVVIKAQEDALRQTVRLEVVQAQLAVRAAKAGLDASNEALANANEQLRLAEGRYQAGVGNIIELSDAQVAGTSAAAQQVKAQYTLALARAQLLQAIGE